MAARNISSSARRSGGKRTVIERPSISAAGYPNIRSAPAFHEVTTPASVLPMMASSEESTMGRQPLQAVLAEAALADVVEDDDGAEQAAVLVVNRRPAVVDRPGRPV